MRSLKGRAQRSCQASLIAARAAPRSNPLIVKVAVLVVVVANDLDVVGLHALVRPAATGGGGSGGRGCESWRPVVGSGIRGRVRRRWHWPRQRCQRHHLGRARWRSELALERSARRSRLSLRKAAPSVTAQLQPRYISAHLARKRRRLDRGRRSRSGHDERHGLGHVHRHGSDSGCRRRSSDWLGGTTRHKPRRAWHGRSRPAGGAGRLGGIERQLARRRRAAGSACCRHLQARQSSVMALSSGRHAHSKYL